MLEIKGFVASVNVPKELNILGMGEKVGVDIFVNGRVRDTNILRHYTYKSCDSTCCELYIWANSL